MAHRRLPWLALPLLALGVTGFGTRVQEDSYAPLGAGVRRFAEVSDARTARIIQLGSNRGKQRLCDGRAGGRQSARRTERTRQHQAHLS